MKIVFTFFCLTLLQSSFAQSSNPNTTSTMSDSLTVLPYDSLPSYPDVYSAATISARMIDGLGFRYRWATEDLRKEDLEYRISETSRTSMETMYHLHSLSQTILNCTTQSPNVRPSPENTMEWEALRMQTLLNFQSAAQNLMQTAEADMENLTIVFQRGNKRSEFPFWNLLNGPIADALWHVGQVVSMRRATDNPIDSRVNVFMGKLRDR